MQTQASIQTPTEHWETVLGFRQLPILAETRQALQKKLKSPSLTFSSLTPVIEKDPALCWHLLQVAAEQNPDCREQLHSAAGCLSLVGLQSLVKLVKNAPVVSASTQDENEQAYRHALCTAHLAGTLAAIWAKPRAGGNASAVKWAAMLAHSVLWPWLMTTDHARNWLHRLSQGDDIIDASRQIFNISESSWLTLARRHHLPDLACQLFQPEQHPDARTWKYLARHNPFTEDADRTLKHQCHDPQMLVASSAAMAWHLHIAPEGRRSQRWLNLSSHILNRKPADLMQECRQAQLHEARTRNDAFACGLAQLASPDVIHFDYPPVLPEQPDMTEPEMTTAEAPVQTRGDMEIQPPEVTAHQPDKPDALFSRTPKPKATAISDMEYLRKLMLQLANSPESFGDWHYLMEGTIKGMTRGIGLGHAAILLPDRNRKSLRTVYAEPADGPLKRLSDMMIPLSAAPLLNHLMNKPSTLVLNPERAEKLLRNTDDLIRKALPDHIFMHSLCAGQQPLGLVIGCMDSEGEIDPRQIATCRQLCNLTNDALKTMRLNREQQLQSGQRH